MGCQTLALANLGSNNVSVLLSNGDGTFQLTLPNFGVGAGSSLVAMRDFNGDGMPDLAVANRSGEVSVLINNTRR
jgi:hypothetical protein